MNRVDGKIAIVTGGARGLGAASAHRLAEAGARIVLTDQRAELGEETAQAIIAAGGEAIFAPHDAASEDDWSRIVALAKSHFGGIDVLVNNAGIGTGGRIDKMALEDWRHLMSINMEGVFLGMKHAIPELRERAHL